MIPENVLKSGATPVLQGGTPCNMTGQAENLLHRDIPSSFPFKPAALETPHPSSHHLSSPHFFLSLPFRSLPRLSIPSLLSSSLLDQKPRAHFGGFSTVRYVLKSVISFCMPGRELGKLRSLSRATVRSIHSRRLDAIASYSSFMFSMSTMMPMIWGRRGEMEGGRLEGREEKGKGGNGKGR